jgi:hypothetical protein
MYRVIRPIAFETRDGANGTPHNGDKMTSPARLALANAALTFTLVATNALVAQETHDHSSAATPAEISKSRRNFSPELQKIKTLAGRWEGTTFRASEGTNPAVMTYSITGAGSAVVETMFPGKPNEMTTVYHDDSSGHLVADHYCTAANQPKLRLAESKNGRMDFVLAPESDIQADIEGHAHKLSITFNEDGTLIHDWLNHYLGKPAAERNITLKKVQ